MSFTQDQLDAILNKRSEAAIQVHSLGNFQIWRRGECIDSKEWGRDVALQLFQFFVTFRHRGGLHKEQIIDRIWRDLDVKSGQQNFKIAHHAVNKVLEPDRESRTESKYILRQGSSYQLNMEEVWIDVEAIDQLISLGNQVIAESPEYARKAYKEAVGLYRGMYLPDRLYEDWSTEERERIQLLALSAIISLSELLIKENPVESIRLAQKALQIDPTWEEAYRIQMKAYLEKGNRPMAIKTFKSCVSILEKEFGLPPLPETKQLYAEIIELR